VFETEPATENPLFGLPNVVCTPHLGASTTEAQENVALQVAEQMSDYLTRGAVPTRSTCRRSRRRKRRGSSPSSGWPNVLGSFAGQVTESADQGGRDPL
jgi:D-3-phosphoglycerate dehydrogenase